MPPPALLTLFFSWLRPFALTLASQGPYDQNSGFEQLNGLMTEKESGTGMPRHNRMFFLSIPPNVFIQAAGGAADFCSST